MKWYKGKFGIWEGYHLLGSFFLAHLLSLFFGLWGILGAFVLGAGYEVFESLVKTDDKYPDWFPFFGGTDLTDPDGGAGVDLICDFVGCSLAVVCYWLAIIL